MALEDRLIVFTNHALDRVAECQINEEQATELLRSAVEEPLRKFKDQGRYKREKYKHSEPAKYYRNGTIIFTVIPKSNYDPIGDVYLVISVFDQRLYLKHIY